MLVSVERNIRLGRKIKACRAECGLTQKELASLLKVTPKTVVAWEQGRNWISSRYLLKICEVCKVKLSYFDVSGDN